MIDSKGQPKSRDQQRKKAAAETKPIPSYNIPNPSSSPSVSSSSMMDMNTEAILRDVLCRMSIISLKLRSAGSSHDAASIEKFVKQRAQDDIASRYGYYDSITNFDFVIHHVQSSSFSISQHMTRLEAILGASDMHR